MTVLKVDGLATWPKSGRLRMIFLFRETPQRAWVMTEAVLNVRCIVS